MTGHVVVIGVGSEFRHDDGFGPGVVRELERLALPGVVIVAVEGEPTDLIEAWSGADLAIVVDAVRSGDPMPGRVHRLTLDGTVAPPTGTSTHGLGLGDAVELARVLGRLPRRLVVYGVEPTDHSPGVGLSPLVAAAVPEILAAVVAECRQQTATR